MKQPCTGQCKRAYTKDFTPQVVVHPVFGMRFILHDTLECPDKIRWRMNGLQAAAQRLREARDGR